MKVSYLNQDDFKIDTKFFGSYLKKLEKQTRLGAGELNVVFVNDPYIRALNKAYRGKDQPTDVLSFNYDYDQGDQGIMGEVYISVETAKRQAGEHKLTLDQELAKLLVHGVLHVHGFDHEEDEDYKKMYAVEKEVLGEVAGPMIMGE